MQRIYCHNCSRQFVVQDIATCPACHEGFVEVVGQEAAQPAGHQRQAGYQRSFQLPGGMGTVHVMMGSGGPPDFGGGYMGPAPDPFELIRALMGGTPFGGQDLLFGGFGGADYDQEQMDRIITQIMNQYQPQTRQTAQRVRDNLPRLKVRPSPTAGTQQGQPGGSAGNDDDDMGMATVHEGEQCSVCHDEFCSGGEVVELPCNHCFHEDCLMPWLEDHNTCPVCRLELPTEDGQQRGGSSRRGPGPSRASSSRRQQQQQQQQQEEGGAEGGEGWMGSLNQLLHNIADRWEATHTGTGGQGGAHAATAGAAGGTTAGSSTRPSPAASRQFSSRASEPAAPRARSYPSMPQPSAPPMPESPRTAAGRAAAARAAARASSSGSMHGADGAATQQQQQQPQPQPQQPQQQPSGMSSESRSSTFRATTGRATSSQGTAGGADASQQGQQQQQQEQQEQEQEQDNGVSLGLAIGGAVAALVGSAVSAMWNRNRRRE